MASDKNVGLHGVKADRVQVTLELGGKNYSQNGEILFKEDAVSGIVIFNLSAYIARENVCDGYLYINFFKDMKMSEVKDMLTIRKNTLKGSKIQDYFVGLLHKAIGQSILKRSGLDVTKSISTLNQKDIDTLASLLTRYAVRVYGVKDNNQVYSGGVGLDTLDSSLQVKGSTGLYCTGELIDVDGECGGYNLQWAWTSGMVVADALNKVTKGK
jgi:predicted Rossmann fold flavoprotein